VSERPRHRRRTARNRGSRDAEQLRARSRADELDAIDEAEKLLLQHRYAQPRPSSPQLRHGLDAPNPSFPIPRDLEEAYTPI
jgi:hypothetical protein